MKHITRSRFRSSIIQYNCYFESRYFLLFTTTLEMFSYSNDSAINISICPVEVLYRWLFWTIPNCFWLQCWVRLFILCMCWIIIESESLAVYSKPWCPLPVHSKWRLPVGVTHWSGPRRLTSSPDVLLIFMVQLYIGMCIFVLV